MRFERYLVEEKKIRREEVEKIRREAEAEVDKGLAFARGSAFPKAEDLKKYLFKE